MGMYRKKPVVIEAMQFHGSKDSANQVLAWMGWHSADARRASMVRPEDGILISTLEGEMLAASGDWIIRGVQGEFYPCKPEIFAATYEFVGELGEPHVPRLLTLADSEADLAGTPRPAA
ncbi:hypothetical protein [Stenotrophomonas acidaminiphila]|uniref:hypothetical protein n=1 Tax=Stenotrophomonas acidaminiphila TaxID=128780 RepID=UPI0024AD20AD|nr:hypothetical protein [Stenotrophomonas acidaminiphila]WHL17642.1 hypothetical protein QLF99_11225 [Stenotrophomonas acidaminiphila]